ncbi:uncharacterized protein KY384_001587 [Bacidia gigantensis]|uniref:uncharacterized protein n=1 Tax=Bacidia gigantensis TaxID=2732470 RepID=UPI001D040BB5|nr:uncharacterized protein KY384_001587 [Bacidia gigantensis]KAG8533846.1 hypothetical protein KY384_001587 [Bacidia gigantensis]
MEDVIDNCQTTFEEDGVGQQTLEDLRLTWQTKLSALKVGSFPWEPPPAPQPMPNPTLPSNVPRPQVSSSAIPGTSSPGSGVPPGPRIKTEPGEAPTIPNLPPNYGNNDARERAVAQLQQRFGADATSQISQIQSQMIPNGQARVLPPTNSSRPNMTPEQQRERQALYQRQQHAAALQQIQQQKSRQQAVNPPQTNGSGQWDGYVAERRARAMEDNKEADTTIRQKVEQMSRDREGGGLILPLSEQSSLPQNKRRKIDSDQSAGMSQVDGANDDDDEDSKSNIKDEKDELFDDDEDAINSELDDSDDNEIEGEPDDGKPTQVMLCTYDKVQRVKNKWKCTLRDGVLNSGGKE